NSGGVYSFSGNAIPFSPVTLANVDFQAANPASDQVVDNRAKRGEYATDNSVEDREEDDGAEAHTETHDARCASIGACCSSHAAERAGDHGEERHADSDEDA